MCPLLASVSVIQKIKHLPHAGQLFLQRIPSGARTHTEFSLNYTRKHTCKRTKLTPIRKETNSQTNCRSRAYTITHRDNKYECIPTHTNSESNHNQTATHTLTHTHSYAGRGQCGGAARKRGRSTLIFMGCFAKRETLISCSFEY